MMLPTDLTIENKESYSFGLSFDWYQSRVHALACTNGFWDHAGLYHKVTKENWRLSPCLSHSKGHVKQPLHVSIIAEKLCLIHSEISEALEAARHGNPPDDKIPEHSGVAAELADAVIRIMDLAAAMRIDLQRVITDKHNFNCSRPFKHGKEN